MKSFEELDAWRRAHEMVLAVYKLSGMFPKDERFGIISQLRRAAASVPANIAEGFGRRTTKDFVRCLDIAGGSLEETRYFLRLSKDLGYLGEAEFTSVKAVCDEVGRLLGGLVQALRRKLG
ncbi:MAG TPA: four helix bundle protein [Candidatus Limnocylindrales bacterium]|nr:four helix bundle protein [Candidatus Limnocylindrales bacterium]